MNIEQIEEVFDSFEIILEYGDNNFTFKDNRFCIEPGDNYWWRDDPPTWEIFRTWPEIKLLTVVNDEFELQDWLINEYNTD